MPFTFTSLDIPDVIRVEAKAFDDSRGHFLELYRETEFRAGGIPHEFVQDNHSRSSLGVLRGLHYQIQPHAQGKLVTVLRGEIFDVAVDLRRGSPTFGRWVGATLSESNRSMLYIPSGFAHGLMAMSDEVDVVYKVTSEYAPQSERGIIWDDADLAIQWPLDHPVLSDRDASLPRFRDADVHFVYDVAG